MKLPSIFDFLFGVQTSVILFRNDPSCPVYGSLKEKNLAGAHTFFKAIMYPNNIPQKKAIESPLFTKDVVGRVDITNTFIGQELNSTNLASSVWKMTDL